MKRPRLLLADDHVLLVDGLRGLLDAEFDVAGSVGDGRAAVVEFERLKPDLLLLDIGLPLLNGIEAARQVKRRFPRARILFVTMQTDRVYVEEAMRSGGSGYVLKQAAGRELVDAIHTVLAGGMFISPRVSEGVDLAALASERGDSGAGATLLTPRQREVLQLIAEGKAMKEIGEILGISTRTVEFHKYAIMEQLRLHTTAELTRYALDHGIAVSSRL